MKTSGKLLLVKQVITQRVDYQIIRLYIFKKNNLIAIDLSKQQALDDDTNAIQRISFTGNLNQTGNTTSLRRFIQCLRDISNLVDLQISEVSSVRPIRKFLFRDISEISQIFSETFLSCICVCNTWSSNLGIVLATCSFAQTSLNILENKHRSISEFGLSQKFSWVNCIGKNLYRSIGASAFIYIFF